MSNTPDSKQEALEPCWSCGGEAEARDDIHVRCLDGKSVNCDVMNYWFTRKTWNMRSRASVPAVEGDAAQRRLQIALGYIKRAANRELPKLPCLMDEMTEREKAIFNVGAAAVGNLQFIARELDALPDAAASSPAPAEPPPTPEQIVYNVAQRDPRFRKYLIEQLTAMGDEQDTGPLRIPQPLQPTGEQRSSATPNYALVRLLNAAMLHPEQAEGYIRQVIAELDDDSPETPVGHAGNPDAFCLICNEHPCRLIAAPVVATADNEGDK